MGSDSREEAGDGIARLLRDTGRRPAVPPDRAARVEASVREHWRRTVAVRRRRNLLRSVVAAAAMILLVLLAGVWLRHRRSPGNDVVARVERTGASALIRPGDPVRAGTMVATRGSERVAIRTLSGHSVRLDTDSRLRILSGSSIALEAGAVYVDSGGRAATVSPLEVHTAFGVLRDAGTQFEARLAGDALELRVREGMVSLEGGAARLEARAGDALRVDRTGARAPAPDATFGPGWAWAEEAAPRLAIEGRRLSAFLDWIARERGLTLRFASDDLRTAADRITLRGSIEGMTLDEALASVLATCGMHPLIEDGHLVLSSDRAQRPAL